MADGQFPVAAATRKDMLRMLVTVVLALLALVASITWPAYGYVFWAMLIVVIAASLYNDLRRPVNYDAIVITEQAIEYTVGTFCKAIRFDDIESLKFVREQALFDDLTGPYIESKWVLVTSTESHLEIMDEWPHRRQLFKAFQVSLAGFDRNAARSGFKAWGEGVWPCYSRRGGFTPQAG